MVGKKYLLLADLPAQRERVEAVAFAFMRAAYLTDSVLFIVVDLKKEAFDCYRYLSRNVFFGSAKIQLVLKNQLPPEQLVQQADCYIIGEHPDELFYVDAALRNGVEIIGTRVPPDEIFKGLPMSEEVAKFRENLHALVAKDLLEKFPPEQFEYFLFHEGLGESTAIFFWLKEYRKPRDKRILMICVQPLREEMMRVCPYVDAVMRIPPQTFDFLSIYYADDFAMKKFLTAHVLPSTIATRRSLPPEKLGTYFITDIFRDFLKIPPSVEFKKYPVRIPDAATERANALFNQMQLTRGKVIFIVTEGIWFSGLEHHNNFWIRLVRRAQAAGYDVVFNGQEDFFREFKSVFLSLFETAAFVGLCGNIVCAPTGFAEAICAFNTADLINWQVVFPNSRDIYYRRISAISRLDALAEIQRDGSDFARLQNIENFACYVKNYLDANIKLELHQWGDTAAEDDALIEKILGQIVFTG